MGMFSRAVDADGRVWQFKTGFDGLKSYKIGDPVPYRFNPDLAMDVRWEDEVHDGILEGADPVDYRLIVIKDHKLEAIIKPEDVCTPEEIAEDGWYGSGRNKLRLKFEIRDPHLRDWSYEAQIAYHQKEIKSLQAHIQYRQDFIAEHGFDPDLPENFMRARLHHDGFTRQILQPVKSKNK